MSTPPAARPVMADAPPPASALSCTRRPPPYAVVPSRARAASASLAHLEPGKRPHGDALLGEHLLDRLLGVLDKRLLGEHNLLEEGTQPPLDDLADRLLRLALVARDLLGDAPLLRHHLGRDLLASHIP